MGNVDRYDYAFDSQGEAWAARLLRRVPSTGAVLELGPGPGAMTKVLKERGQDIAVVENDPEALEALGVLGVEVIPADLERPDGLAALAGRRFDAILACDVLEHLRRPDAVLQALARHVQSAGQLVISVPNIAYAGVVAALRNGVFDYADKGQLDRTHVHFFTRRSLEKTLLRCGWTPRYWEANRVPLERSEFAGDWAALPDAQRQALCAGWPEFDVYQWMVVATPSADGAAWEVRSAQAEADSLREELQALQLVHGQERASLQEHQKAFGEARELIARLESEVQALRTASAQAQAENEATQKAIEQRVQQRLEQKQREWREKGSWLRRWLGR